MSFAHDACWDAADKSCGPLMLELRKRLRGMPGRVLKLTATDPSAPEDLPAYCRMTGHELLRMDVPSYWIRARENP